MDVFEDEPHMHPGLAGCHNAVLLPHIASATQWTRSGMVSNFSNLIPGAGSVNTGCGAVNGLGWGQRVGLYCYQHLAWPFSEHSKGCL